MLSFLKLKDGACVMSTYHKSFPERNVPNISITYPHYIIYHSQVIVQLFPLISQLDTLIRTIFIVKYGSLTPEYTHEYYQITSNPKIVNKLLKNHIIHNQTRIIEYQSTDSN